MEQFYRGRRLRRSESIRRLVRETRISVDNLVYPLFIVPGSNVREEISSMPGQYRWSIDLLVEECRRVAGLGIPSVLLFGIPATKDAAGTEASAADGIVQRACTAIKEALPELCIITDVCLCEYTSHGHCGILTPKGNVHNDLTLQRISRYRHLACPRWSRYHSTVRYDGRTYRSYS